MIDADEHFKRGRTGLVSFDASKILPSQTNIFIFSGDQAARAAPHITALFEGHGFINHKDLFKKLGEPFAIYDPHVDILRFPVTTHYAFAINSLYVQEIVRFLCRKENPVLYDRDGYDVYGEGTINVLGLSPWGNPDIVLITSGEQGRGVSDDFFEALRKGEGAENKGEFLFSLSREITRPFILIDLKAYEIYMIATWGKKRERVGIALPYAFAMGLYDITNSLRGPDLFES